MYSQWLFFAQPGPRLVSYSVTQYPVAAARSLALFLCPRLCFFPAYPFKGDLCRALGDPRPTDDLFRLIDFSHPPPVLTLAGLSLPLDPGTRVPFRRLPRSSRFPPCSYLVVTAAEGESAGLP